MIYANQHAYDNASAPELDDYREEKKFADFVEFVAFELLAGRDCQGIDSKIMMVELELNNAGFALAREIVSNDVTERQYRAWADDQANQ